MSERPKFLSLEPRQLEALAYIALGYKGPEAAKAMGVTKNTMKNSFLARGKETLGAKTLPHAVWLARPGIEEFIKERGLT